MKTLGSINKLKDSIMNRINMFKSSGYLMILKIFFVNQQGQRNNSTDDGLIMILKTKILPAIRFFSLH